MLCNLHENCASSLKWEAHWWYGSYYSCFKISVRKTTRKHGKMGPLRPMHGLWLICILQASKKFVKGGEIKNVWDDFHSRGASYVHHRCPCKSLTQSGIFTFCYIGNSLYLTPSSDWRRLNVIEGSVDVTYGAVVYASARPASCAMITNTGEATTIKKCMYAVFQPEDQP